MQTKKLNRVMLNGDDNEKASRLIDLISKKKKKIARAAHFLTREYARAYHELLQGQGYANESLAHS